MNLLLRYFIRLICKQDLEFIVANKVGYIVNCSSDKLENLFEGVGVMYFSFQWPEATPEVLTIQIILSL